MAKGEQKGNRESKKPKKEKVKTIAAAPSQKGAVREKSKAVTVVNPVAAFCCFSPVRTEGFKSLPGDEPGRRARGF